MERYVNLSYVQGVDDWYNPVPSAFKRTYYPTRQCTQDDFGDDQESIDLFNSWAGFSLFCPDIPDGVDLKL